MTIRHKFVEYIPDVLEDGVIYITIEYRTAVHKCACGCGNKVVTPITPNAWKFTFDGKTISLLPSIGNWNFDCKSHYWIIKDRIEEAKDWTERKIQLESTKISKSPKKVIKWPWKKRKRAPKPRSK